MWIAGAWTHCWVHLRGDGDELLSTPMIGLLSRSKFVPIRKTTRIRLKRS